MNRPAGVPTLPTRIKPDVTARIEVLAQMSERRRQYEQAGDKENLLKLAEEYAAKEMFATAHEIRMVAKYLV